MPQSNSEFTIKPIGYVENACDELLEPSRIRTLTSRVILNPELVEGLMGLEEHEKILVIFYFDRLADDGFELIQHKRGRVENPRLGVFAICSPRRPNHIGVTEVELLRIEGNILHVTGLDAVNGTPVLDIKPAGKNHNNSH